jgi:glycogen debranching enzyme
MSYHNGSVWPHDNALVGLGLGRAGFKAQLAKLFDGLYGAQTFQPAYRLPELFCGFQRKRGGPIAYPVSCSPQAWAAATPFGLLGACLGLEIDRGRSLVLFNDPVLPEFLEWVTLRNLRIGTASIDVRLEGRGRNISLSVLRREGDCDATISKA